MPKFRSEAQKLWCSGLQGERECFLPHLCCCPSDILHRSPVCMQERKLCLR